MSALSFQRPLLHNYALFFHLYLSYVYLISFFLLSPHIVLRDVKSLLPVNV